MLIPAEKNVRKVIFQNHFQKAVAGTGDRPAVFVMVLHNQSMVFSSFLELAVVVGAVEIGLCSLTIYIIDDLLCTVDSFLKHLIYF